MEQFSRRFHGALQTSWYAGSVQTKHLNGCKHRVMCESSRKIYVPAVGGKLQGSVRESLCHENKKRKQSTHTKRSYFLIKK